MYRRIVLAMVAGGLAGCAAVGPDYVEPKVSVPDQFSSPRVSGSQGVIEMQSYWNSFADPRLSQLVADALAKNHDIRVAAATLREVRAMRSEVRGGLFPKVDVNASATRNRLSLAQLPGTTIAQRTDSNVDVGFDASWEIDLFGGVRRSVEAATALVGAAQADLDAARVSIAAETGRQYFELRGLQTRIKVAQGNLQNQVDSLNIISVRFNAGRGTDFDVSRATGLVENTRAVIPALQAQIERTSFGLAVLTGRPPGALAVILNDDQPLPPQPPSFAVENPSELLRRRPDVASAERRVAAATASIGVSTAELFPSVTLLGAVGVNARRGNDLGKGDSVRYSVGPSLTWNLLDFGRIRSRIEQADARFDGALASYEKTVLLALQEGESALSLVYRLNEQVEAVRAAAAASRNAANLAQLRFQAGATDLLDLLDAQRQVLAAEDQLSQVETARVTASVALFKAMGGGWTPAEDVGREARPRGDAGLQSMR